MVLEQRGELEQAGMRFQASILEEALGSRPDDIEILRFLAHAYSVLGRREEGLKVDLRLVELLPRDPRARYNLACSYALAGRNPEASQALRQAVVLGFEDLDLLRRDPDLDALREDPAYREACEQIEKRRAK